MRLIEQAIEEVGRGIGREVASLRLRAFQALVCHHALAGTIWLGICGIAAIITGLAIMVARDVSTEWGLIVGGVLALLAGTCGYGMLARRL